MKRNSQLLRNLGNQISITWTVITLFSTIGIKTAK